MPKPLLFVLGDSISCYYGPHLQRLLRGHLRYDRRGGTHRLSHLNDGTDGVNGGDSRMVRTYLEAVLKRAWFRPDWLLLNCGLHDIKTDLVSRRRQVPLGEYAANLRAICGLVQQAGVRLLWVNSTPVHEGLLAASHPEARLRTARFERDVARCNRVAAQIMAERGIPVLDLHGFTRRLGPEAHLDHVHFTPPGAMAQAAFLAGNILAVAGYCRALRDKGTANS